MAGEKIIAIFIAMTIASAQNNIQVIHDLSGELSNGETGISLLIDVWNHSYAVLENDTEPVKADGKSTEDDVEIFKTEEE